MKNRTGPPAEAGKGPLVEPIDQDRPLEHRVQRNAGVKIVARGVQRQIAYRRRGPRSFDERGQLHGVALALGIDPADVADLRLLRRTLPDRRTPTSGMFDFAVDHESKVCHGASLPWAKVIVLDSHELRTAQSKLSAGTGLSTLRDVGVSDGIWPACNGQ